MEGEIGWFSQDIPQSAAHRGAWSPWWGTGLCVCVHRAAGMRLAVRQALWEEGNGWGRPETSEG